MSESQAIEIGRKEHKKIVERFGLYADKDLNAYVDDIGRRLAKTTERNRVDYKFHIVDTHIVNAFALPGGYIYVSRGLVALANSEAELAAVLAHELAHITARHSAERYSHAVVSSLGTGLLSAAIEQPGLAQLASLGNQLYIKGYSREQEREADKLGIRYLARAGYTPGAMAGFLSHLERHTHLQSELRHKPQKQTFRYFSTHPRTQERVSAARKLASETMPPSDPMVRRQAYLERIEGVVYGGSRRQGFVRDNRFYHPELDFTFQLPDSFHIVNQPDQIAAFADNGTIMIFDIAKEEKGQAMMRYLEQVWLDGRSLQKPERINVNGMPGATAWYEAQVNGRLMRMRVVAIRRNTESVYRMRFAIPRTASSAFVQDLRAATHSLRSLNDKEKREMGPRRVRLVAANQGDAVSDLAGKMAFEAHNSRRFRVLNGLDTNDGLQAGRLYKIVE
jgi:predicted Zn-dependent protease